MRKIRPGGARKISIDLVHGYWASLLVLKEAFLSYD